MTRSEIFFLEKKFFARRAYCVEGPQFFVCVCPCVRPSVRPSDVRRPSSLCRDRFWTAPMELPKVNRSKTDPKWVPVDRFEPLF